jgi:hypothetical protein
VIGGAVGEADLARTILSRRVLPACGIMLFIGNFYMSWLATRMKTQYGRDFTAQPYGINTVGAYPFLFDIMLPIALGAPANGTDIGTPLETAWKAGCTGNFIVGIINVVLGCVFLIKPAADFILKWVPIASFVVPVAGVGLTWLALNQIGPNFATPGRPSRSARLASHAHSTGSSTELRSATLTSLRMSRETTTSTRTREAALGPVALLSRASRSSARTWARSSRSPSSRR